jgi:dTDP-4-amino-4,6-dideoxygalactose transaminase
MSRTSQKERLYLSPPYLAGEELALVQEAIESGWIAPLGPQVDAFEREFAEVVGVPYALALSSGTAAIHLALIEAGVQPGDEVAVSTLTFAASAFPIRYLGARPVFIDSERQSWNMDPDLLAEWLQQRDRQGRLPKAVVLVHLYGQSANIQPMLEVCQRYEIPLIEDAAEALGATYYGRTPGAYGRAGVYSFNGNKIITTSGGGMLVSHDEQLIMHARKLATQAREPFPHYEHTEVGYNYRMSNLLAAVGRAQLRTLEMRVQKRRWIFEQYRLRLQHLPGIEFMPEASWGRCSRWLSVILINPDEFGATPETVRQALEAENIESRPIWKPLHLQPVFTGCEVVGGAVAEDLFRRGLCLPSGTGMTEADIDRVAEVIQRVHANCRRS